MSSEIILEIDIKQYLKLKQPLEQVTSVLKNQITGIYNHQLV